MDHERLVEMADLVAEPMESTSPLQIGSAEAEALREAQPTVKDLTRIDRRPVGDCPHRRARRGRDGVTTRVNLAGAPPRPCGCLLAGQALADDPHDVRYSRNGLHARKHVAGRKLVIVIPR